jgi:threonine/homoserine/homoserine lactone efflux protein
MILPIAWDRLALFTMGEILFSLAPGPTVIMISAHGFRGGFGDAMAAMAGTQAGNTLWYLLCAAGLGALTAAWPATFVLLRYLGAAYLIGLGGSSLYQSLHPAKAGAGPKLRASPFLQAVLTQLGNPKAMLFFLAFVPQFLNPAAPLLPQYAVLFVITLIGEGVILAGYGWLAAVGSRAASPGHAIWRERIGGAVMVLLGLWFALRP